MVYLFVTQVSMPHAALWVVQLDVDAERRNDLRCFNAARGFVGGATASDPMRIQPSVVSMPHAALWVVQHVATFSIRSEDGGFNAARGFVGGATRVLL